MAITIRRRPARVATVSHRPPCGCDTPKNLDRLMAEAAKLIERAARMGADLIAFPEVYPQAATPDAAHFPEPADGGSLVRVREMAAKHRLHIVWPRYEYAPDRGGLRNTAILVDRDGQVVGRYDKMFPTIGELDQGIIPGTDAPCFDTDLGRVGMLICFDLNFREVHDALARQDPDVLVFSSMYRGGRQAQHLALATRSFVITAIDAELGLVLDRCGRVIKESTYEMLAKHGPALTFDYHTREAFFVIESTAEADIRTLLSEFNLEPAPDYYARSRARRAEILAKK
jgi:predicted amidohydrolase